MGGGGEASGRVGAHLHWECDSSAWRGLGSGRRAPALGERLKGVSALAPRAAVLWPAAAALPTHARGLSPASWPPLQVHVEHLRLPPGHPQPHLHVSRGSCGRSAAVVPCVASRCHRRNPGRAHLLPDGLRTTCYVMQVSMMLPCIHHHPRRFWKHVTSLESRETKRYLGAWRGAAAPAVPGAALLVVCTGCCGTAGQHATQRCARYLVLVPCCWTSMTCTLCFPAKLGQGAC